MRCRQITLFQKISITSRYDTYFFILLLATCLNFLSSCSSSPQNTIKTEYDNILKTSDAIKAKISNLAEYNSLSDLESIKDEITLIELNLSIDEVPLEHQAYYYETQGKIDSIKQSLHQTYKSYLKDKQITIFYVDDTLINAGENEFSFYGVRKDSLYINIESSTALTVTVYNLDSESSIKKYYNKKDINDVIYLENSAVYSVVVNSKKSTYINMSISKMNDNINKLLHSVAVTYEQVEAKPNEFRAQKIKSVKSKNLFYEPKKISLRSWGKELFSGNSRSVVTLSLPSNTIDVAYQLRISTSKSDRGSDGEFYNDFESTKNEVKILGLPIYSSNSTKTSLVREVLNRMIEPEKEEDAYCDLYVFTSQSQATKFQNRERINKLNYNIDLSSIGTQSCNNQLPTNGKTRLYLGFENGHTTTDVYIWLEAVALIPTVEYIKNKYTAEEIYQE